MKRLVLVRHGQSIWNKQNLFTGWTDVDLTPQGIQDAHRMGQILKGEDFQFTRAYTSVLKRAIITLEIILEELDLQDIPISKDWRLNERHYGKLQGKSKIDILDELSWEQLHQYRRGYLVRPAALEIDDPRNAWNDEMYQDIPRELLPRTESLDDAYKRIIPYVQSSIIDQMQDNEDVLISAHGNALRVMIKHLEHLTDNEIEGVEFAIGDILVYTLNSDSTIFSKQIL
jgi:2,3-bisphosphoglycerate-dependent phosphoglycerate mutase